MNPSTEEILQAVNDLPAARVLVLPNNKNLILAAEQAVGLSVKQVAVIPTRTVPQGLAAMLSYLPDGEFDQVRASMQRALGAVHSGEVTTASRTVDLNGVTAAEGQIIGLHDGALAVAGDNVDQVVVDLLARMGAAQMALTTLYYGADVDAEAAGALAEQIRTAYPNLEAVEMLPGGQPHYFYILSLE
jgi:dihydroxyacetone kinase-like predicted kinase